MKIRTLLPLALVTLAGCKKAPPPQADLKPVNLDTIVVHAGSSVAQLTIPAHIEADPTRLVHVFAPLSGQVVSLNVVAGQQVARGQVIATLRSGDIASARADYEKAKIEADRSDRARDRGKMLLDHEVLAQASYADLVAAAASAHADLNRTAQRLRELGFAANGTGDTAPVVSPIAGTVLDVATAAGELQRSLETSNGIATIANLDTVWVEGEVYERDIALVKRAEHVDITVQAYPGEVFHGTLANIGDTFDPTTHTLRTRVILQNPGHRLKPAMFAQMLIDRPATPGVLVPASAIVHDGDTTAVYIKHADGKFQMKPVNAQPADKGQVEVTAGLKDGDVIVKTGAAFLRAPAGD